MMIVEIDLIVKKNSILEKLHAVNDEDLKLEMRILANKLDNYALKVTKTREKIDRILNKTEEDLEKLNDEYFETMKRFYKGV